MLAAVNAFDQDDIDLGDQLLDRADDFDAVLFLDRLGESFDARVARLHVLAAAGKTGDDLETGEIALSVRIIEEAGKRRYVRGVQADNADLDGRLVLGLRHG